MVLCLRTRLYAPQTMTTLCKLNSKRAGNVNSPCLATFSSTALATRNARKIFAALVTLFLIAAPQGSHRTAANNEKSEPTKDKTGTSSTLPGAPLSLAAPREISPILGTKKLSKQSVDELTGSGMNLLQPGGNLKNATACLYWAVKKGAAQKYNLACCYARSGQVNDAFYFLQSAAVTEGVDPDLAAQDTDLASLRKDTRWASVSSYLKKTATYWSTQKILRTSLVVPKGYKPDKAIPVVIGLHGLGGNEKQFVNPSYQVLADELGVAVVGVNGTVALGPRSFKWSEDVSTDSNQIVAALNSLKDRLKVTPGDTLLFGFSQGGALSFEIAARNPSLYKGALCLSPGMARGELDGGVATEQNQRQRFVFCVGGGEHPGNIEMARQGAKWCKAAKVSVDLRIDPKQKGHEFPADFNELFPKWVQSSFATK